MSEIRNKRQFYALWHRGLLGNRPRTWQTLGDLLGSGYALPVVVRSMRPGWKTIYGVEIARVGAVAPTDATFNELLDDDAILLQGEAMRGETGLELTYSTLPLPMKLALARETLRASGLTAKLVLDHYLNPTSRDDLEALWDLYPGAVIEFGVYARNLGDQPHRNTLIWEVRHY